MSEDEHSRAPAGAVRIGIVEDDTVLGQSLAAAVRAVEGFVVAGVAETLAEGIRLADAGLDVLLVDLALPDGSGLDLITHVREPSHSGARAPKVLVISVFGDVRNVIRAIECGADGYLLKGADIEQVASAIRTVLAGGAPISPAVAGHILARVRNERTKPTRSRDGVFALTPKEIGVLEHLAKGLSYKEVARLNGVSYHTVADHVKAIYRKLAVNSRGEAVFEAVQAGLIKLRD